MQKEIDAQFFGRARGRILLLGVTPELAALRFPAASCLVAVDSSRSMIKRRWSVPAIAYPLATQGTWERLPVRKGSMDLVLGDGSLCVLENLTALRSVLASIAESLDRSGKFIMRAFVRPDDGESLDRVFQCIRARQIGSFHAAKWRVAMSLHEDLRSGVVLNDVFTAFRDLDRDRDRLASMTGWSRESIDTVDAYDGVTARYIFPTLSEWRAEFAERFDEIGFYVPSYELGERCPTFVMRKI